jgi:hypothetical protein
MSIAGVLKAGLTDAISEAFDPEKLRKVKDDIVNLTTQAARASDRQLENNIKLRQGTASLKDITNQITAATLRQTAFQSQITKLEKEKLGFSKEVRKAYEDAKKILEQETAELKQQAQIVQQIEKRVGTVGVLFKGLSKIPFLGDVIKADQAMTAMNAKAYETGNRFKILGAGLKEAFKGAGDVLVGKFLSEIVSAFKRVDTDAGNLARSMNVTYQESVKFREQLTNASLDSEKLYATGAKYAQSIVEMNAALGAASTFDKQRVDSYTKLRDLAKFEAQTLEDLNRSSLINKKTLDQITASRLGQINLVKIQTGRVINERQVLKDIAATSSAIKINFIGSDQALAKAAATARTMGTDLNKLDKIAGSFLNFEQSIRSQMEAELITGREMNLERARYYALTNDTNGLMSELAAQNITAEKYGSMNRIAQEATAEALGMSRDEMSQMLIEQQAITNLGAKDLESAKKRFDELVRTEGYEKAVSKLGNESLARQFQQQSVQERLTQLADKFLSVMDRLEPILKPIVEGFLTIAEAIAKSGTLLKGMLTAATALAAIRIGGGLFGGGGFGGGLGGGAGGGAVPAGGGRLAGRLRDAVTGRLLPNAAGTAGQAGAAGGGGFLSSLNPISAFKEYFKSGGLKTFLKSAGKIGIVSTFFEAIFANSDIKDAIAGGAGGNKNAVYSAVGTRALQGIGSVLGGAALGALLTPIPGGTLVGGMLGSAGGGYLGKLIGEAVGPESFGKGIVDTFYGDEAKAAGLATGGLVTQGGLARVDTGEVYLGRNSLETMKLLVEEMRAVKQAILSTGNTTLMVDGQKIATVVGKNVASSYGNLLNPGTTYS